jgi:glutathione S-transferase
MMVYYLTISRTFVERASSPILPFQTYLQRIGKRPAYQRAMAKAEPGMPPLPI